MASPTNSGVRLGRNAVFKPCLRWFWLHRKLTVCLAILLSFAALNVVAFNHAHSMTHFSSGGIKTPNPEALSFPQKVRILFNGVNLPKPLNTSTPTSLGLPFQTCRFQNDDGTDLESWYVPNRQSKGLVLMFHGYAASKSSLLKEAQAFHEIGYSTFLVDFRGSGGSMGHETTIGVYEADDVARAVEYARSVVPDQPFVLYGQSMGSAAILRAIFAKGVRPAAVVIECPFDRLIATVGNRFSAMGLPAFPFAQLLVFWGGVQHGFNGFKHNPAEYAKGVECPVLVLHGENDTRVSRAQLESVFNNLGGEKRLKFFPAGHEACLASDPPQWKRSVSAFLSSLKH